MAGLHKLTIGVRTFLRDEKLFKAVNGILATMPEVEIFVVDCGEYTKEKDDFKARLIDMGHEVANLEFAVGFGAMSNMLIDHFRRDYLLFGSDDFDFSPLSVREGIEKMVEILDTTDVDVISGRVSGHGAYEFDLEEQEGGVVIEHPVHIPNHPDLHFVYCDLTVNYSIFKRRVFEKVRFEQDVPIQGGEHGAQFLKIKRAGYKVAYAVGVEIEEQGGLDSRRYRQFRARHTDPPRVCFDRIGVKKYILGNGQVDWDASAHRN